MTYEDKSRHEWACNTSQGHEQCPYATPNGSDGMLICCWRKDHPAELGHQTSSRHPLTKTNGRRRWRQWLARERRRGNDPAASWGLCKEKTGLARKAQGKSWAGADLPELRAVPLLSPSWSARSLVGASMATRKRWFAAEFDALPQEKRPGEAVELLVKYGLRPDQRRLRLCPGDFHVTWRTPRWEPDAHCQDRKSVV